MYFRFLTAFFILASLFTYRDVSAQDDLSKLMAKYNAKQAVFTMESNDDLEKSGVSVRFVSPEGQSTEQQIDNFILSKQTRDQYTPMSFMESVRKFISKTKGTFDPEEQTIILVTKLMKNGELSPDDARYASYLEKTKKVKVQIFVLPDENSDAGEKQLVISGDDFKKIDDVEIAKDEITESVPALDEQLQVTGGTDEKVSFAKDQWKKFKSIPAKPTWTAFNVSIWKLLINLKASTALYLYQSNNVSWENFLGYVGAGVGFTMFFGIFNQTMLNWIEFWMNYTEEGVKRLVKLDKLKAWVDKNTKLIEKNKNTTDVMVTLGERAGLMKRAKVRAGKISYEVTRFISRRGDVLIAFPIVGIVTTFFVRYALGEVGDTASVLTVAGFGLAVVNVIWGSIFAGPVNQTLIYLKSQGRLSKKNVLKLSALDELKMQFGKVGDFGLQALFTVGQAIIGTTLWATLWATELIIPKPLIVALSPEEASVLKDVKDKLDVRYKSETGSTDVGPTETEIDDKPVKPITPSGAVSITLTQEEVDKILASDYIEKELGNAKSYEDALKVELFMEKLVADGLEYNDTQLEKLATLGAKLETVKYGFEKKEINVEDMDPRSVLLEYTMESSSSLDKDLVKKTLENMAEDLESNDGRFFPEDLSLLAREDVLDFMLESTASEATMLKLVGLCKSVLEVSGVKYRTDYYKKPEFEELKREFSDFKALIKK
jgi:hypothetical protein